MAGVTRDRGGPAGCCRAPVARGRGLACVALAVPLAAGLALGGAAAQSRAAVAAASSGGVSWGQYRAEARALLGQAARGPLPPRLASRMGPAAVRWPDGSRTQPAPTFLPAALSASPASPVGALGRHALAAVAGAPASPPPPVPAGGTLARTLRAVLAAPAFRASRPGVWAAWRSRVGALLEGLAARIAALWHSPGRLRIPRALLVGTGAAALAALLWAVALLYRSGWERGPAGVRRRAARADPPRAWAAEAAAALAVGDVRRAVGIVFREALQAAEAQSGVRVRPGWTAAEVARRLGPAALWPSFPSFAAFHELVVFGPPPREAEEAERRRAAAAAWVEELRRWTGGPP